MNGVDMKRLEEIGRKIRAHRERHTWLMSIARDAAKEAIASGATEVEVARALGVDRARTLRRWLGK